MMPIVRPIVSHTTTAPSASEIVAGRFVEDQVEHVAVGHVAAPEVEVQEDVVDVVAELHGRGRSSPRSWRMRSISSGVGCRPARSAAGSVDGKTLKMRKVTALTTTSSSTMPARRRTM